MTMLARCERCGATLGGVEAPGLCPACLMQLAVEPPDAHDTVVSDWQRCAVPDLPPPGAAPATASFPPFIGAYRIIEPIGEGGMGVVYKAEQRHPIHRTVAIKVLRAGAQSKDAAARFEAERQALAMMSHPNVARVFDAGMTDDGRPYVVMEYVRGQSITSYCDLHRLPTRKRLELFLQACDAIQHAHQKAIIHRDVKPSNILVTVEVGDPQVKVIDFGVAKAVSYRLTEHTLVTEQGRLVGTPEYMSPEQAEMGALDVDTRTDIYSLGIVLYELLTGTLPFDPRTLRQAAFDEFRRIIREDEAPRPSNRLTRLADQRQDAALHRSTDWQALHRELRHELEWIPLKALSKDRSERYRSASEMADDIHNYLDGRPLIAGPKSATYRIRKFVGKHRRSVGVAAALVLLFLGLLAALGMATRRALSAEKVADNAREQAQQEAQRAVSAERVAEERLARKLVFFGDQQIKTNQLTEAAQSYVQAMDIARGLSLPDAPITARLFAIAPGQTPLMGAIGKADGVGGFAARSHANRVVLIRDGRTAITAEADGTLKQWDLRTGALLRTFPAQGSGLTCVALTSDGRTAISASFSGEVRVWDVPTATELRSFPGHGSQEVFAVAISPNDQTALSGDGSGDIKLWNIHTLEELHTFTDHTDAVMALAFAPDGRTFLSGSRDKTVRLWDLGTYQMLSKFTGHADTVNSVAFFPDGRSAVSGSFDGTVLRWDLSRNDQEGQKIGRHSSWIWDVAVSPDGALVASGDKGSALRVWDGQSHESVRDFCGQTGEVNGVAFSSNGRRLVSTGADSLLRVWDMTDPTAFVDSNRELAGGISAAAFCGDDLILFGTPDGKLLVYDAATRCKIRELPTDSGPVRAIALSADGRYGLTGGQDGTVRYWDLMAGAELRRSAAQKGPVTAVALSPGNGIAVWGGADHAVRVWNLLSSAPPHILTEHNGPITSLTVLSDQSAILSAAEDGSVRLTNLAAPGSFKAYPQAGIVRSMAFAPDGRTALLGSDDGAVRVCDAATGTTLQPLAGHSGPVCGIVVLPDGATAWSGGSDGTLKLWDLSAGALIRSLPECGEGLPVLAVSPSGARAVIGGSGRPPRLLEIAGPAGERLFYDRVQAARAIAEQPHPGAAAISQAMSVFGEWYAFRGQDDWAAEMLERARAGGKDVSPLLLARCYWRLGRMSDAAREFRSARERHEAAPGYLDLCLQAVTAPSATTRPELQIPSSANSSR